MDILHSRKYCLIYIRLCVAIIAITVFSVFSASHLIAKEFVIGLLCDRTGPTAVVGSNMCPGFHDYIALFNKNNTMPGHSIRVMEVDHGYNVPRGIEAYGRFKKANAVSVALYGTPHTVSLTPKLAEDKVLGTSPGFGSAAGANGKRFPYLFPLAASYWSQAASAVKFIMDKWEGSSPPKIAYLYYDNPAGREPFPILDDLQKKIGFTRRDFAVPAPAIEMRPQVLDIARRFRPDWVLSQLFGRGPGVSLKEFTRVGFPRNRVIGFVWAAGEPDIAVAGWKQSEGYYTIQFAHVGSSRKNLNRPVLRAIGDMYKAKGRDLPKAMDMSVYYNRGVATASVHAEAIRSAVASKGPNINGEDVKNAMERIRGFALEGFMPAVNMSKEDHEGGGFIRIFQVRDGGFVPASGWMQGYRDLVMKHVLKGS